MCASLKVHGAARLLVSGAALSLLAACGGSGGIGEDETTTHLRVFNAIGDSPSLQFVMDTTVVATAGLGAGSAYSAAPAGSHTIQLKTVRPGRISGDTGATDPINLGAAVTQNFAGDQDYTVIAAGTMAAPQVFVLSAPNQRTEVAATKLIWRLAHAVPGGPQMDLWVTAPEAGIATPQLITSLGYGAATDTRELTLVRQTGQSDTATLYVNMTFELRAAGTNTVLFNSGPLQFNERNRVFFAIVPNAGGAPTGRAVQLAALGVDGSGGTTRDPSDPATIRLVNMSNNSGALDLIRVPPTALATNVAFGAASTRTSTANGATDLFARETANPSNTVFVSQFTSIRDQAYSIYAVGPLGAMDDLILGDDKRSVPSQTRFRFVHAAASLGTTSAVDVYLTRTGVPIDFNSADDTNTTDDAANVRQVAGLGYRAAGGYVSLEQGTYDVYFATKDATTTLIGPIALPFNYGAIQTIVLTDSAATPSALQVRVVDDTAN